jgi:hypothetical protein
MRIKIWEKWLQQSSVLGHNWLISKCRNSLRFRKKSLTTFIYKSSVYSNAEI